jgi:hypothetical protein
VIEKFGGGGGSTPPPDPLGRLLKLARNSYRGFEGGQREVARALFPCRSDGGEARVHLHALSRS